jgi:hypothetical protein
MWLVMMGLALAGEGSSLEDELYGGGAATTTKAPVATPAPVAPAAAPAAASAAAPADALVEALVALPDHAARRARLASELAAARDGESAARLGQAVTVVAHLERTGRGDPTVVRLFLRAALASDPATRAAAVEAASRGGDPPVVAVVSPATVSPATVSPASASPASASPATVSPATVSPATVSPAGDRTVALAEYKRKALSHGRYAVRDGSGRLYSAMEFARLVGDAEMSRKLRGEEQNAKSWMVGLSAAAVVSTAVGLGVVAANPSDTNNQAVGSLVAAGGLGFGACAWIPPVRTHYWHKLGMHGNTTSRADAQIEKYNAALRDRLGLTATDVAGLELLPAQ